jgi:hypothetical protein
LLLLLDNEKGSEVFPWPPRGRNSSPDHKRAVLVGQIWSAELAETLIDVYSHLLNEGYTLEDVSRLIQEPADDRSGD